MSPPGTAGVVCCEAPLPVGASAADTEFAENSAAISTVNSLIFMIDLSSSGV